MIVRCIFRSINELTESTASARLRNSIRRDNPDDDLTVGQDYTVMALASWNDQGLRVYIHSVETNDSPYPYPIEYFSIVDSSIPNHWVVGGGVAAGAALRLSFPAWANDSSFYERLVDSDEIALRQYDMERTGILKT